MVNNTETDETLKIRVMAISKQDLGKTLKRYKGTAWDQSPLFQEALRRRVRPVRRRAVRRARRRLPLRPFAARRRAAGRDVEDRGIGACTVHHRRGADGHADGLVGRAGESRATSRRSSRRPSTPPWRSLRESDDARYLAMCMPRFLGRLPYGAKTSPVDAFNFEEDTDGADHDKYAWCNAAYAMATNINRSFKEYGWCSRIRGIESGGAVENLPSHTFPTDDGGVDMKCPTEIAISDRREAELSKNGFLAMIHRKNSDFAAFIGAQSLQKPTEYDDPDATSNAALAARLPYLFACNRFAHYLKCMVRDKVGSFKTRDAMERWLNSWIMQYVDGDPTNSSEQTKSERPLAAAQVVVEEVEGAPGYYQSKFFLKPHYQLEGLSVSLRLVSKLPAEKA
jgi:type VI secretion system protein ImpC